MRKSLRELAVVEYGASPSLVRKEDGIYPIYGTGGVQGFASRSLFDRPITVVGRKGTLGNPIYSPLPCWVIDTAYAVIAKPQIDAKWLYFNLSRFDLESLNEATGVPSINRNYLYRIEFWSPAYPVQQRIAKILTTVDNQIEKTEALIAKYQSIKQGLMHDLFTRGVDEHGRLRPTRDQAPQLYKESELGWIPKDWTVRPITWAASDEPGSTTIGPFGSNLVASDYRDQGVPVVFVRDVKADRLEWVSNVFVEERKASQLRAHSVQVGDVVATKMGLPPCVACVYPPSMPAGVITADIIRLRPAELKVNAHWLASALNHERVAAQVRAITGGVTRPKVTLRDFRSLVVAFPERTEQDAAYLRLDSLDSRLANEEHGLAKSRLLKLGLMQDLLTGKVPVNPEPDDQDNSHTPSGLPKAGVKARREGVHA